MLDIGLVGCGTIGSRIARAIQSELSSRARITAISDHESAAIARLCDETAIRPRHVASEEIPQYCDWVVEAASVEASALLTPLTLQAGKNILVLSVGGLLLDREWERLSLDSPGKVVVPSGALAGLDGLSAMIEGEVRSVKLTTRKPPGSLEGTPYAIEKGIQPAQLTKAECIFEGTPLEAIRTFPKNTNVAAALALAVRKQKLIPQIRVIADPNTQWNTHRVQIEGDCGRIDITIENAPSGNPKTSELAVRSSIAALRRILQSIRIGT